jgi:hypothetical protein
VQNQNLQIKEAENSLVTLTDCLEVLVAADNPREL